MSIIIVTGASQNHYKSLKQFLNSCKNKSIIQKQFVYNLGLNTESIEELKQLYPDIILNHFDFSKYPAYFNISVNAGEYAWKPVIIHDVVKNYITEYDNTILLWCDAGDVLYTDLQIHYNIIKQNNIYSPTADATIKQFTHPKTLDFFNIKLDDNLCNYTSRNGAILGFNLENEDVRHFIQIFRDCACNKECIAPEGSDRSNHRQDQSVFTILYYNFFKKHTHNNIIDSYLNIAIHRDCD
jgi:hypothetical protein